MSIKTVIQKSAFALSLHHAVVCVCVCLSVGIPLSNYLPIFMKLTVDSSTGGHHIICLSFAQTVLITRLKREIMTWKDCSEIEFKLLKG